MNFDKLNQIDLERELKDTVNELDKTNSRLKMIEKAIEYRLKEVNFKDMLDNPLLDFLNLINEVNNYTLSELDDITSNLDLITQDLFDEEEKDE